MALENEGSNMVMPVSPMYGSGNGGFGFGNDGGWWILILFLLLGGNRWGNGFGGGSGTDDLYPWMNQSNQINGGFRDQMISGQINSIGDKITSGFGDVQTALCGGFAGVNASVTGAQNAITQQLYTNQIADMQQSFALQSQLAQCCCDNRAATADLKYTVATENCADRTAAAQNTRDIIDAQTRGTQAILDKLCALELDGVKNQLAQAQRENVGLQNQVNMANLAASQTAQTAAIRAGQVAEIDAMYNRLRDCPVPTMPVYGMQPIFTCPGNNTGCGCNGTNF